MESSVVTVLGAGSWGTALANLLAECGHRTTLWGRNPTAMQRMAAVRRNPRYLPDVAFFEALAVQSDLDEALRGAEVIVLALPSLVLPDVARAVGAFGGTAICASKGLQEGTGALLLDVLEEQWPDAGVALLSGPNFAVEVARGQPAAAVAAAKDPQVGMRVQELFTAPRFRVYTSQDTVGVAIGGALKNVIAIAAGCSDGLGFGFNARAALITRGLNEVGRLAHKMGGDLMTLAGLAGMGDLVLTCTTELSRNRTVGYALGRGETLAAVSARLGQVTEGVETALTAIGLADKLGVDMPITAQVAAVLRGDVSPREAVACLMARELGPERL